MKRAMFLTLLVMVAACGEAADERGQAETGQVDTVDSNNSTDVVDDTDDNNDETPREDGLTNNSSGTPDPDPTNANPGEEPKEGGCSASFDRGDSTISIEHDGMDREYRVYVPSSYDPNSPTPVVLNFHGRSMTASQQALLSQMDPVAEEQGFLAVYPEGTGSIEQTFNGGWCCGSAQTRGVDDVGFTAAILDDLESRLCVDTGRVYAIGMSNGGFMSHRLGCDLADRITAIGGVAGTLGMFNCSPARPVPTIHFHGTSDMVVPYDGFVGQVSVDSTIDTWRDVNGCSGGSEVYFSQGDVTCEKWDSCDAGSEVRLCTVDGGGHTWPGGTSSFVGALGKTTENISASEHSWEFFQQFEM